MRGIGSFRHTPENVDAAVDTDEENVLTIAKGFTLPVTSHRRFLSHAMAIFPLGIPDVA